MQEMNLKESQLALHSSSNHAIATTPSQLLMTSSIIEDENSSEFVDHDNVVDFSQVDTVTHRVIFVVTPV